MAGLVVRRIAPIRKLLVDLKTEYYHRHEFATRAAAIHAASDWIEHVYNRRRRHSALGQIPPVSFERQHINPAAQAA